MSRRIRIRIGFPTLLFLVILLLTAPRYAPPTLLAALLHECGHLLAARLLQIPVESLTLSPLGARMDLRPGVLSYHRELLLAAAGPLVSLLLPIPLLLLLPHLTAAHPALLSFLQTLATASLFLGLLNLLPIHAFDGGRILTSLLSTLASVTLADRVERLFSALFLVLLWLVSVYLLLVTQSGLSLFVFSTALFARIFVEKG